MRWLRLVALFPLLVLASSAGRIARAEEFVGSISKSGTGASLRFAKARCLDAAGEAAVDGVIELDGLGKFRFSFGTVLKETHLRCSISADGFLPANAVATRKGDDLVLGGVTLMPYLETSMDSVQEAADGRRETIDVWLTNRTARSLLIQEVALTAEEIGSIACFDAAPQMVVSVVPWSASKVQRSKKDPGSILFEMTTSIPTQTAKVDQGEVTGDLRSDSCGHVRLTLRLPCSFSLSAEDKDRPRKVRFVVPSAIDLSDTRKSFKLAGLKHQLFLKLNNGDVVSVENNK